MSRLVDHDGNYWGEAMTLAEIEALTAVAEAAKAACLESAHDAAIGGLKPELAGRLNDLREALSKLEEAAT